MQGAPCVALALIASWYLPDDPSSASFLLAQESRIIDRKLREGTWYTFVRTIKYYY